MDPVTMAYYATVCALLGLAGPSLGGRKARLVTGAIVGLGAAAILPALRGGLGL